MENLTEIVKQILRLVDDALEIAPDGGSIRLHLMVVKNDCVMILKLIEGD